MLNCYITDDHLRIRNYSEEIRSLKQELENILPIDLFQCSSVATQNKFSRKLEKEKQRLTNKYKNLHNDGFRTPNTNVVKKLSSKELSDDQLSVFSKGSNFAADHSQKDVYQFIANVEPVLQNLRNVSIGEKITLRQRIISSIKSTQNNDNLTRGERIALKQLKQDPDIVTIPADKGNTTVVMNTDEYKEKI